MQNTFKNYQNLDITKLQNAQFDLGGDLAVTQMALILGAISEGETMILNCSPSPEVAFTIKALQDLGVDIQQNLDTNEIAVAGKAYGDLAAKTNMFYSLASDNTLKLIAGVLAFQTYGFGFRDINEILSGEFDQVDKIFGKMGCKIKVKKTSVDIKGQSKLKGIKAQMPIISPDFKAAWLLAGLFAAGKTEITEAFGSPDHMERLLMWWGVPIETWGSFQKKIVMDNGGKKLTAKCITAPGDFAAAAPLIVLGLLLPDCHLTIRNVNLNYTISGLLSVLQAMGGDITICNQGYEAYEPIGDLQIKSSKLQGVTIKFDKLPNLIHQLPMLAVAATFAQGTTTVYGVDDYRNAGFDHIQAINDGLRKLGGKIIQQKQALVIEGTNSLQGGNVNANEDFRVASALAVAGILAKGETNIANSKILANYNPTLWSVLQSLNN